ncbi:Os02g0198100 [Oryza sativa Japonica Group]|uniref:Os02g0198100 protein n=1 Tax=Oryza sativa subsp. japonica TaxID=39947 RepID=A0A0P0VFX0_ORYSJ|nr:Os02g0198100 [Oryza sativa Japonica Group]
MATKRRLPFPNPTKASPRSILETKTATKRRRDESAENRKAVYLVAELSTNEPSHSVFMVDAAAAAAVAGGGGEVRRAHPLSGSGLTGAKHGMSFVAVRSEHGSWILGAGVVYAISRRPRVRLATRLDYLPWVESLSFNMGVPRLDRMDSPYWKSLPPPPLFPCLLRPSEYRNPPDYCVSSFAVVGSHILLSMEQLPGEEQRGTYGFHVVDKAWEKVHDCNLPFVGQAVSIGGSLFAAAMPNNGGGGASVFHMSIIKVSSSSSPASWQLLVQEFPVASLGRMIPQPRIFSPLGEGSFCSVGWLASSGRSHGCQIKEYQIEGAESKKDLQATVQVKHQDQTYQFKGQSRFLDTHMPIVAALSM